MSYQKLALVKYSFADILKISFYKDKFQEKEIKAEKLKFFKSILYSLLRIKWISYFIKKLVSLYSLKGAKTLKL